MKVLRFEKALLVVPPTGLYIREDRCQTPIEELVTVAARPPVDLMYIAAMLEREGVECRILDCPVEGKTWQDFETCLAEFAPGALFICITTPTLSEDLLAASIAKRLSKDILTVAKGPHFHFRDESTLAKHPDLDMVIRGEYEQTAADLARECDLEMIPGLTFRSEHGFCRTEERPFVANLDDLPFPSRHLVCNDLYRRPDLDVPQTTIVVSRGCPFKCVFCLSRVVAGTKPRTRSPENIIGEIRICVEQFGIKDFLFRSDTFTARRSWIMEFCQALRDSGLGIRWSCNSRVDTIDSEMLSAMKSAGCWLIAFGLESGSQEILNLIHKGITTDQIRAALRDCRRADIRSSVYFLLGLPWETEKTFQETVRFSCEISPDFIEFFYIYPFEGTELYDVCIQEGLLNPEELPESAYSRPAFATRHFTLEQLAQQRHKALKAFYLRPKYIMRTLLSARSPKALGNYIRYGWKQLQYLMR